MYNTQCNIHYIMGRNRTTSLYRCGIHVQCTIMANIYYSIYIHIVYAYRYMCTMRIIRLARAAELYCLGEIVCAKYFSFIDGRRKYIIILFARISYTVITIYSVLPTTILPNRQLPHLPCPPLPPSVLTVRRFLVVAV